MRYPAMLKSILATSAILLAVIVALSLVQHGQPNLRDSVLILLPHHTMLQSISKVADG